MGLMKPNISSKFLSLASVLVMLAVSIMGSAESAKRRERWCCLLESPKVIWWLCDLIINSLGPHMMTSLRSVPCTLRHEFDHRTFEKTTNGSSIFLAKMESWTRWSNSLAASAKSLQPSRSASFEYSDIFNLSTSSCEDNKTWWCHWGWQGKHSMPATYWRDLKSVKAKSITSHDLLHPKHGCVKELSLISEDSWSWYVGESLESIWEWKASRRPSFSFQCFAHSWNALSCSSSKTIEYCTASWFRVPKRAKPSTVGLLARLVWQCRFSLPNEVEREGLCSRPQCPDWSPCHWQ